MRQEYAHHTSHQLIVHEAYDLYAFEDLPIQQMTKRDESGRVPPNGRQAKAGLNRAILASAWGEGVAFTRYKALRHGELVIAVPFAYGSQECAICAFISPDNRPSQAEFVCQRCGPRDNADPNAAVVIAKRGIRKLLSGDPLTTIHKSTRIFRTLGPERSEVTPGESAQDAGGRRSPAQRSANQELSGALPEPPALTPQG